MEREVLDIHEESGAKTPLVRSRGETSLEVFSAERSEAYQEKLKRGIKVVIGGPSRSGKSVLFHSLIRALPSAYPLPASPDGEGDWLQRLYSEDPALAQKYRKKGEYTQEFREDCQKKIEDWDGPLMLIDMGGRINPDDAPMIKGVTHAIILASDLSKVSEWREFFENNNIEVVATIHSHYDGARDIQLPKSSEEKAEFKGSIHHLERGEPAVNRETVQEVASIIGKLVDNNSYYHEYEREKTEDPAIIHVTEEFSNLPKDEHGRTLPTAVPVIYEEISRQKRASAWLEGIRCSWETMAFALALEDSGAEDVRVGAYGSYIPVKKLPESEQFDERWWDEPKYYGEIEGKPVYVVHNKAHQSTNLIAPSVLDTLTLPKVPEGAIVIISGGGPNWLKASIASGYRETASAIAGFQPGIGSTIAWSEEKDYLGKIIPGNV
ncbi:hypothetical protein IIY24_00810 [Candidatus Saccharibacteria bacterium]|nr:hypothetical protein [Candidatus Saccharibacteria bacterium]